jgi:hypothetical protein
VVVVVDVVVVGNDVDAERLEPIAHLPYDDEMGPNAAGHSTVRFQINCSFFPNTPNEKISAWLAVDAIDPPAPPLRLP